MAFGQNFTGGSVSEIKTLYPECYWPTACLDLNNNDDKVQDSSRVHHDALHKSRLDTQRRRKRTTFSKAQLCELERAFSVTQYPDIKMKEFLASITGLPESKIQVWFQNRRARYFKSKKPSRDVSRPSTDYLHSQFSCTPTSTPQFPCLVPPFPPTPSLPSPPGYPAPSLPQSTRLSTIMGSQAMSLPEPASPIAADQATSCSPQGGDAPGYSRDHYYQTPDLTDYCHDVLPHSELNEWGLTEDLEAFLGDTRGSEPVGSRCASVAHPETRLGFQTHLDHQHFSTPDEYMEGLSDLCFPDLGDFSLSDLDISAAMIDYLLG